MLSRAISSATGAAAAARQTEVGATGELAHDDEVGPPGDLGAQRGAVGEMRMHLDRTKVGEDVQLTSQPQQTRLAALLPAQVIPRGAADSTEQHRVGCPARLERLVGQRRAEVVDRLPADGVHLDTHPDVGRVAHRREHAQTRR